MKAHERVKQSFSQILLVPFFKTFFRLFSVMASINGVILSNQPPFCNASVKITSWMVLILHLVNVVSTNMCFVHKIISWMIMVRLNWMSFLSVSPIIALSIIFRGSCSQILFKIGVLKNFANFTGKKLRWLPEGLQLY